VERHETGSIRNKIDMADYSIELNSNEFRDVVRRLVKDHGIDEVVETGTYLGTGSTSVFAGEGLNVFTIECSLNHITQAVQNLEGNNNVCFVHGLSLKREELIKGLMSMTFLYGGIYDSTRPKVFYTQEVLQPVLVEDALSLFAKNESRQLVFLDSAGGVGYLEFLEFMSWPLDVRRQKVLLLDDVKHVKHARSVQSLKDWGFDVGVSQDGRFAWCQFIDGENSEIQVSIR
jgi:predicted O-methyltransferase YrrM